MIGWKCKYGYCESYPPTSLSDCVFLDDSVCTIPVQTKYGSYRGNGYPNIGDIANYLEDMFADDYYYIYGLPCNTHGNDANNIYEEPLQNSGLLNAYVPSLKLACPNTWDRYYNEAKNNTLHDTHDTIYIPSLHVVAIYNSRSPNKNLVVYRETNGVLSQLTGWSYWFPFIDGGADFVYTVSGDSRKRFNISVGGISLKNYDDNTDLSNYSNYYRFELGVSTNAVGNVTWSINTDEVTSGNYISSSFFKDIFNSSTKPDFIDELPPPPDPLDPIGPSGPGGGGGNFDQNSDIIGDSSLPTISAADTGFTRIYSPTLSQVQDLAQYLWTDETVVETIWNKIKQLLENPMDAIISFSLVPVPVQISGTKNFALAYIDTGVAMNTVANQFVDVDCGTFELKEYYGSALDYSPNTKVSCFLPFIGVVTLNTDEVMNTTLNVKYRVDIVSGSCVAKIFVNESCLYQYSGHCSIPIPISAADFSSYLAAAIGVAKLAIGAAVGGGAGAAAAGASEVDVSQATSGAVDSKNTGEQSILEYAFSSDPATSQESSTQPTRASFDGISAKNITNVVGTVMGSKLHVEHSGSFSGNTGYLGVRRPYLIIQRPRMCMPNEYRSFNGYPSMITLNIGDCKGYTKVQQVQLKNVPATNPEQSEIMQLLKGGIII